MEEKLEGKTQKLKPTNLNSYIKNYFNEEIKIIHFNTGIPYTKLTRIINNQINLSAEEFLLIAKFLAPSKINEMADYVFEKYLQLFQDASTENKPLSTFGNIISKHLYSKEYLAKATKISVPILNNLMKVDTDVNSKLVAAELYLLCRYIKRDFKETLEELYPKFALLDKEQQLTLEEKFNTKV